MLSSLIDDSSRQQLCRVEVADCEPLEPCFLAARQAVQLSAANVPQLDIDTVRTALAEQENRHRISLAMKRTKGKTSQESA